MRKSITNPVVSYSPQWAAEYQRESNRLLNSISELMEIHHIGSTSVIGLSSKSEIDILGVIPESMYNFNFSSILFTQQ
jgi:GrpB-like predicted nucleotidyltransferase (UPF0157 family)